MFLSYFVTMKVELDVVMSNIFLTPMVFSKIKVESKVCCLERTFPKIYSSERTLIAFQ